MAKKYLSLEETAAILGLSIAELNRRRERGDIRGFADRGTWKFKQDDVEEFRRQLHPDSSPDVPLLDKGMEASVLGDSDNADEQPTVIRGGGSSKKNILQGTSDSDVRLVVDDSITGGDDSDPEVTLPPMSGSDSDVRLLDEDRDKVIDAGSDSDVQLVGADSDSDVKLVEPDSDSDVKMVQSDSDSDVKMVESDSDSDVQMVQSESDSDVKMTQSDSGIDVRMLEEPGGSTIVTGAGKGSSSDVQLGGEIDATQLVNSTSDVKLTQPKGLVDTDKMKLPPGRASDSSVLADDSQIGGSSVKRAKKEESGISLELPDSGKMGAAKADSGVALGTPDSGISLEAGDSGISLEAAGGDSGISLEAAGSGIALEGVDDSGISLHEDDSGSYALADDSGIDVASASDSGIALDSKDLKAKDIDHMSGTVPMVDRNDLDIEDTQADLKAPGKPVGGAQDGETSVILFQDEDEEQIDTQVRGGKAGKAGKGAGGRRRDSDDDVGALDTADDAFDLEADSFAESVDFDDNDLEVVEDVLGDSSGDFDEEIASLDGMDVFDAADEDFEDSFLAGESQQEFAAPTPALSGAMALAAPAEWGLSAFIPLLASTLAMLVCAMLMVDMVRTMWGWQELTPVGGPIIEFVAGLFSGN